MLCWYSSTWSCAIYFDPERHISPTHMMTTTTTTTTITIIIISCILGLLVTVAINTEQSSYKWAALEKASAFSCRVKCEGKHVNIGTWFHLFQCDRLKWINDHASNTLKFWNISLGTNTPTNNRIWNRKRSGTFTRTRVDFALFGAWQDEVKLERKRRAAKTWNQGRNVQMWKTTCMGNQCMLFSRVKNSIYGNRNGDQTDGYWYLIFTFTFERAFSVIFVVFVFAPRKIGSPHDGKTFSLINKVAVWINPGLIWYNMDQHGAQLNTTAAMQQQQQQQSTPSQEQIITFNISQLHVSHNHIWNR